MLGFSPAPKRAVAALVALTLSALAAPAAAQPAFTPPLDAPTPIEAPISFALAPGASAACVSRQTLEGADLPVVPEARTRISVEQAEDGLRLRLADPDSDAIDIVLRIAPDGAVTLDPASMLGVSTDAQRQIMSAVLGLAPELQLHRRTLGQDDPLYDPGAIEQIFGQMFTAMAGPGFKPEISGGSYLRGETDMDGRRVVVFRGNFELAEPDLGMRVVVDAIETFDVETGLRAYDEIVIRIPAPPGLDVPEVTLRQISVCTLSGL